MIKLVALAAAAVLAVLLALASTGELPPAYFAWWDDPMFWGLCGAIAGWGMSAAAIRDAALAGPEIISPNMTCVLLLYSGLFAWWAWEVIPRNMLLCLCHITNIAAQGNQARRFIMWSLEEGRVTEVKRLTRFLGVATIIGCTAMTFGGLAQQAIIDADLGPISALAASPGGPFTVHCWAPMSKWLISGASFLDLNRPTDKISIAQYSALTATGAFFTRYGLLVTPVNYVLCSVNIALFFSSLWHLSRKIRADYCSRS